MSLIRSEDEIQILELDNTLVSCHAPWSGPSLHVGKYMLSELSRANIEKIRLLILDIDSLSIEMQKKLFNTGGNHGYFESCWIEKGQIVKAYRYKYELEPLLSLIISRMKKRGC